MGGGGGGSNSNSSNATTNSSNSSTTMTSPDWRKRPRTGDDTSNSARSPRSITHTALSSETSRDRSNPARNSSNTGSSKRLVAPANNRSIHDFFSSTTTSKRKDSWGHSGSADASSSGTAGHTAALAATSLDATVNANAMDWQARCQKLQQQLQDKDEQLKAVTNNKTILHTALQAALEKTKGELVATKTKIAEKEARTSKVLEDLLRWKSNQQAKDLREKLAADGARLGRIVYARTGMRALESWEEGYATKDLEQRKQALAKKRKAFETRAEALKDKENDEPNNEGSAGDLERIEARESVHMHLKNLRVQETELAQEEQALNDEKGAHIRALKRVASEDASRFRSRPKVRRWLIACSELLLPQAMRFLISMTDCPTAA